jgi:hypothetical protein
VAETGQKERSDRWRGRTVGLVVVLLLTAAIAAAPAAAQGSVNIDVEGSTVTVTVIGTSGYQVRVEAPDDSILSTGVIAPEGQTQMLFDLPAGDHRLEVIVFDFGGNPTSLGEFTARVAGPPPPPPGVAVTPGTTADNRTVFQLTGPAGTHFQIDATREGDSHSTEGDMAGDGTGRGALVLASGDWNYAVTLSTDGGPSAPTTGTVHIELGEPPAPVLELVSPPGRTPVTIGVTGPAQGRAKVVASLDGQTVTESADLDLSGKGQAELALRDDGEWEISATVFDVDDKESPPATLEGGALVSRDGPPLDVELIEGGGTEFAYRVITEPGTQVTVTSETPGLQTSFMAEEAETEVRVTVPEGDHIIEVAATNGFGNTTTASLSSAQGGSSSNLGILLLIILGLLVALGVFAFTRRQEIVDWWNTRQYH